MNQSQQRLTNEQYNKALMFCFNYFDQDKDGRLSRIEFRKFLGSLKNKLNFTLTTQISDYCFDSIPKQDKEYMNPRELEQVMGHYYYNVNM